MKYTTISKLVLSIRFKLKEIKNAQYRNKYNHQYMYSVPVLSIQLLAEIDKKDPN